MDCYDKSTRSRVMRSVHGKNTSLEICVRKMFFRAGFRYRLHKAELPGKPDIIFPKYKTVVFVNGCFWHQHPGCKHSTIPSTNRDYWEKKLHRNIERDKFEIDLLKKAGWRVFVIWECRIQTQTRYYISYLKKCACKTKNLDL